jgi:LysM repeat protein
MRKPRLVVSSIVIAALLLLTIAPSVGAAPLENGGGSRCIKFEVVRWGDTLARIAARHGTSVWYLQDLNGLKNPNRIFAGMKLCVLAARSHPSGFRHLVKWGETLNRIGARYGWSASYLAKINGISNPNRLYAGQVLLIPYHW